MNDKYERKTLKLKSMSYKEYINKNPISSPVARKRQENKKTFKRFLKRYAYIFLGIGSSKDTVPTQVKSAYIPDSSAREWRQSQSMEDYVKERIQRDGYLQLVDGRGDPEHCNCDHDHDDR